VVFYEVKAGMLVAGLLFGIEKALAGIEIANR
jgi:hypothetical protein